MIRIISISLTLALSLAGEGIAVVIACLLVGLAGCRSEPVAPLPPPPSPSPAAAARPQHPPHLFTATVADPKTFNPLIATDAASLAAVSDVFEALVRLNPRTAAMEPALAEHWDYAEDGRVVTIVLRDGVRWHDGQPLTAADVVFTFDAIADAGVPSPLKAMLTVDGQRLGFEAVDDRTVRVRLPRPFAPLLNAIAAPIVPRHVLAPALAAGELAQRWGVDTPPAGLVGTGPYRLERYVPGQFIHLVRNPDYWMRDHAGQPLPYLAEQTIRVVPDPEAAYARFLAGDTDIHTPRPEEVRELQASAAARGLTVRQLGLDAGMLFVTFNRNPTHYRRNGTTDPRLTWFTDPYFLRAVAHGIDKQAIIGEALFGLGRPAVSFLSPAVGQFHNPTLIEYRFDLAEARRLLAEGGYVDRDGDGVLEDGTGNPVELTLATNAGNPVRETICAKLEHDWNRGLGLRVRCKPLDFALLVEKLDITFDWDAMLMGLTGSVEPHGAAGLLRSSGSLHVWNPRQASPATAWEAEIDGLVDAASRTLDLDQRRQAYWRIQEIINRELPMIQLVHPLRFTAFRNAIENYEPSVWGVYRPELIRFRP